MPQTPLFHSIVDFLMALILDKLVHLESNTQTKTLAFAVSTEEK